MTSTAKWADYDQWHNDRFGVEFDFAESLIGAPSADIVRGVAGGFWDGATAVAWANPPAHGDVVKAAHSSALGVPATADTSATGR